MNRPPLLRQLSDLSARLGKDSSLVQGAGGNTSIKQGQTLWIKASGKWLSAAEDEDVFIGLDLAGVRARIAAGRGDDLAGTIIGAPSQMRPSIETTLHALLPHAVVLHVHSVRTIALAVLRDAQIVFGERLAGLRWTFVPYHRPGLPLTAAVQSRLDHDSIDVLVLGNHGLVVGGANCREAEALLNEVERRLEGPLRHRVLPDLEGLRRLGAEINYRLPRYDEAHNLAGHPGATAIVAAGSLYPDHVVFLGPAVAVLERYGGALKFSRPGAAVAVVPGQGTLVRNDLSAGAEEMVRALGRVIARIPDGADVLYLSKTEEDELFAWEAEKYRRSFS